MASPQTTRRKAPSAGKQRQSREMALQMMFQWDLAASSPESIFAAFDLSLYRAETSSKAAAKSSDRAFAQAQQLVRGTIAQLPEIDRLIVSQAENWRMERMSTVDRNLMRLAIHQFMSTIDVPQVVIIDESVELAKKFGTDQSGAFVNGVLDALMKDGTFPGART